MDSYLSEPILLDNYDASFHSEDEEEESDRRGQSLEDQEEHGDLMTSS